MALITPGCVRQPNVEKLKKYLNDVLTDQLPPLKDLRRGGGEIGMMDLGAAEESSFIIEQVSEMREAIIADQDWDKLSTGTLVRAPTAWTITRHDGPNHLGL